MKLPLLLLGLAGLSAAQTRTMYLENYCQDTVWFKVTSGAAPTVGGGSCSSDGDCVLGSACNKDNGICFWTVPTPGNKNFRLDPRGGRNSLTFPFLDNGQPIVWSGNVGGCLRGTCEPSPEYCDENGCTTPGGSPETKAEFTFQKTGSDFYDTEVINGFNLPVAIYPLDAKPNPDDPYNCGSPGAPLPLTNTGNSTWKMSPPSIHYNWVEKGGPSCSDSSQCPSGTVCGLSNNVGESPRFRLTCGKQHGFWTANQVCGVDLSFGAPFDCSQPLGYPNEGAILWNLYACSGPAALSCYQDGASNNCCGCANWDSLGIYVPPITTKCKSTNPLWVGEVQPGLQWLKEACPTCYTYPFDDMSSTFVCKVAPQGETNLLNFKVVWCPPPDYRP